jgi:hypothetical protein
LPSADAMTDRMHCRPAVPLVTNPQSRAAVGSSIVHRLDATTEVTERTEKDSFFCDLGALCGLLTGKLARNADPGFGGPSKLNRRSRYARRPSVR